MGIKLLNLFLAVSLVATALPSEVFAQKPAAGASAVQEKPNGPKKQLATIVFAGIAGAILGLSTLSFYGRPQEKLSNIAVGFAIGVIGGAVYTTYKAASQPRNFMNGSQLEEDLMKNQRNFQAYQPPKVGWKYSF
jgi:hypothetical protein